jgi:hypothetical protein
MKKAEERQRMGKESLAVENGPGSSRNGKRLKKSLCGWAGRFLGNTIGLMRRRGQTVDLRHLSQCQCPCSLGATVLWEQPTAFKSPSLISFEGLPPKKWKKITLPCPLQTFGSANSLSHALHNSPLLFLNNNFKWQCSATTAQ